MAEERWCVERSWEQGSPEDWHQTGPNDGFAGEADRNRAWVAAAGPSGHRSRLELAPDCCWVATALWHPCRVLGTTLARLSRPGLQKAGDCTVR